jgi:hypothetical protein
VFPGTREALPFSLYNRLNLAWEQLRLYELSMIRYCPILTQEIEYYEYVLVSFSHGKH